MSHQDVHQKKTMTYISQDQIIKQIFWIPKPIVIVGIIIIILVTHFMNSWVKSLDILHIDTTCHN